MMGQHGFISWDNDEKACYTLTLESHRKRPPPTSRRNTRPRAATPPPSVVRNTRRSRRKVATRSSPRSFPWLRGQVSQQKRFIGTVQDDDKILRFVNSKDAARLAELGTSCPDHFLRTKIKPLYVDWNPQSEDIETILKKKLAAGLEQYRKDYAAYYAKCKHANSPAMRDPNPTVVLIPGVGMVAWGKDKSESRVTAEFYNCAVEVMRGAEAIDKYIALPQQEAFDIEYWLLEEAKLQRMPAEKELARQVVVVIGAGSGIGKETAHRIVKEGAHLVCVDLNEAAAQATAKEIDRQIRSSASASRARVFPTAARPSVFAANITDRASIRAMLDKVALAYGGFDSICVTAGIFVPSDTTGHIPDDKWALTFNINVTGSYLVADEAFKTWKEQGLTRQSRPHDVGQRGGREERLASPTTLLEGRREPPRARTRHRTRTARAGKRRRSGHRCARQRDVPARPRHRLAREIRDPFTPTMRPLSRS